MFCKYCGNKISDDSLYCPKCGEKIGEVALARSPEQHGDLSVVQDNASININRDVLVEHLYQLQVIEFSVNELTQELNGLNYEISNLGIPHPPAKPSKGDVDWGAIGSFLFLGILAVIGGGFLYSIIPIGLFSFARTVGIIIIVGTILMGLISVVSKESQYNEWEEEYKKKLEKDGERVQEEMKQRTRLLALRPEYESRLEQAMNLRDKAYSANIIPKDFRNIYAVYYFYNYLSTSQSSFESAMLHYDLKEIKAKLDINNEQQRQQILQNAQILAQNDALVEQNEELIMRAAATERNTARAAQYAEIAAANSEITAFTNTIMASIMVSKI